MPHALSYAALSSRALISLSGEDWRDFLQGLITQDVETLQPGELRFGGLLTPQGRLLFDLFVVGRDDGCWLDVEGEHRAALTMRLTMYRLRAKVVIAADETPVAALFGQGAAPPGWIVDPRLAGLGWRGYGAASGDAAVVDEAVYETHRLALGVPGPADWGSEKTYPIEANFDLLNGIDFHKGCFVGQETTSRMKRRGQIKNRMLPLTFEGAPPAFDAELLLGDRRAGGMLSGQDGRAMALLRLDRIDGDLTADGKAVKVDRPKWLPL
ncbi:MAG: folate-binding protein YgfZ [Phenylobacterium sp.]|uniref:CAF17-like 4Fe-4S cluster assembly/insertion protein YgfZ n=1 Tax=Phenylobacterium sp. TaxID=1871053 RepID=UPI001B722A6F|nr:folate-binding protein YgfZ [Phenylobacterium sp.]MBP7649893.1 folate-binding protein YgfZ [Phenylobacterium sp.]MBP7815432.1 folate-binding protein YgfZ [Phenylobacterium sp.]